MNAIYSFSGKPFLDTGSERENGGFLKKGNFLHCVQKNSEFSKKIFGKNKIYADKEGIEILSPVIDSFSEVVEIEIPKEYGYYFAYGKFVAYLMQEEPFLHFDLDFIPFRMPAESILNADLVCEFSEHHRFYTTMMHHYVLEFGNDSDKYIKSFIESEIPTAFAYCVGVFGGNRLDFIHEYARRQFYLLSSFKPTFPRNFHTVLTFEQGMVAAMLAHEDWKSVKPRLYRSDCGPDSYIHYIGSLKKQYSEIFSAK